jgi:peptide-methionine (R)-S-oxide reductase
VKRRLLIAGAIASAVVFVTGTRVFATTDSTALSGDSPGIIKTRDEWRELLSDQQFQVLFEESTERPWSSHLNDENRDGTYVCSACYLPLFLSKTKFDSGTGWPSFYQAIETNVGSKRDWKMVVPRTEYHCARCGGHQGHVFADGPKPTGQRWCNNGVALQFVPKDDVLPELRL